MSSKKTLFFINASSGNWARNIYKVMEDECIAQKIEVHLVDLKDHNLNESAIIREIQKDKWANIAVAGGDGTCSLIAKALYLSKANIPMGIIPAGSANGMATELGIPKDVPAAFRIFKEGNTRPCDMIQINEHYCLHLADVGLNAKLIWRFELEEKRGLWRYGKHLLREVFTATHYHFRIHIGKYQTKRKAISLTFANACKYGTGAVINPLGLIDDGKFEICILKPFPWYYILPLTFRFFKGTLNGSPYVEILSCREAEIHCTKPVRLQVDGELFGKTKKLNLKVIPNAISLIAPSLS